MSYTQIVHNNGIFFIRDELMSTLTMELIKSTWQEKEYKLMQLSDYAVSVLKARGNDELTIVFDPTLVKKSAFNDEYLLEQFE
jgi:hypothetical protein